jgi:hypothetical protein
MFVRKDDFDEIFKLNELIDNNLITMEISYDIFYHIRYNEEIYNRFVKILKMVYNEKIHKYIKMIKYAKKYEVPMMEVFAAAGAKQLAEDIDKHILNQLLSMSCKK